MEPEENGAVPTVRTSAPDVSAVVCCYTDERWEQIGDAIASLESQSLPPLEILLVVDYNPGLAQRCRDEFAGVEVIENEHERGLSGGKNTALDHAKGSFVAFLDDDGIAEPRWIERLRAHFEADDVVSVGSRVDPLWADKPSWYPEEFGWVFGCSYRGQPTGVAEVRNTFGGASMFRLDSARAVGSFSSDLGRKASGLGGGEETEYSIRLARETGGRLLYEPATWIDHHVPASRSNWRYFTRRCWGEGASKAVLSDMASGSLGTEQRYLLSTLPTGIAANLASVAKGDLAGFGRAAAIVVGAGSTAIAYAIGQFRR